MRRSLEKSNAYFRQAVKRLPLGVSSNFRFWGEDRTLYIARGEGGRLWDIDGNEYVDYRLGYGPTILGYCHDEVDAAAREGQRIGSVFALATEAEYRVAERIHRMVPAAELVRFSNSGTEAVMAALRLARGYTGKDGYVIVEGGYHGLFDSVMWAADLESWSGKASEEPEIVTYGAGIPQVIRQMLWQVPLNDLEKLEDVLKRRHDKIAALLVEPIMGNCCSIQADPEYLKGARELCDRYGVLLIIDEVKTGFRVARGGVQELYGVRADIMTFAKAVANGYPLSVIAGREDVMRAYGRNVAHGGTFTGHAMSLAAAEKTLEILDESDALDRIKGYGERLQQGMSAILAERGIAHSFSGHPAIFGLFFRERPPRNYRDWKLSDYSFYDALAQHLIDNGVIVEPDSREPWFMCLAHALDEACLDDTLARFERSVDATVAELQAEPGRPAAERTGTH